LSKVIVPFKKSFLSNIITNALCGGGLASSYYFIRDGEKETRLKKGQNVF